MMNNLSSRDIQEISSYLDHQLDVRSQVRLEERMQLEPQLRSAFEEMQALRFLLRSQPRLRAPRNFTLTPAMAGKPRAAHAHPTLRLATALAGILFIVLFLGDLLSQRTVMAPAQFDAAMLAEEVTQPEAAPLSQVVPEEAPDEAAGAREAPPPAALVAPTETPTEAAMQAFEAPAEAKTAPKIAPTPVAAEATEAAEAVEAATLLSEPTPLRQTIFGIDRRIWQGLEILLALMAIAGGLSWFILRRRA